MNSNLGNDIWKWHLWRRNSSKIGWFYKSSWSKENSTTKKAHVLTQLLSELQDCFDEPFNLREAKYSENQSSDELVN